MFSWVFQLFQSELVLLILLFYFLLASYKLNLVMFPPLASARLHLLKLSVIHISPFPRSAVFAKLTELGVNIFHEHSIHFSRQYCYSSAFYPLLNPAKFNNYFFKSKSAVFLCVYFSNLFRFSLQKINIYLGCFEYSQLHSLLPIKVECCVHKKITFQTVVIRG